MANESGASEASNSSAGPSGYPDSFPKSPAHQEIDAAIRLLVPPRNRPALVALFDGRAHWQTSRSWRSGRRGAPQWALDMLVQRLQPYAAMIANSSRAPLTVSNAAKVGNDK